MIFKLSQILHSPLNCHIQPDHPSTIHKNNYLGVPTMDQTVRGKKFLLDLPILHFMFLLKSLDLNLLYTKNGSVQLKMKHHIVKSVNKL